MFRTLIWNDHFLASVSSWLDQNCPKLVLKKKVWMKKKVSSKKFEKVTELFFSSWSFFFHSNFFLGQFWSSQLSRRTVSHNQMGQEFFFVLRLTKLEFEFESWIPWWNLIWNRMIAFWVKITSKKIWKFDFKIWGNYARSGGFETWDGYPLMTCVQRNVESLRLIENWLRVLIQTFSVFPPFSISKNHFECGPFECGWR